MGFPEWGERASAFLSKANLNRFIKGFIYRNCSRCPENEYFLDYIRYSFLMNLKRNLPRTVLDKSWPVPPPSLREVGAQLREGVGGKEGLADSWRVTPKVLLGQNDGGLRSFFP